MRRAERSRPPSIDTSIWRRESAPEVLSPGMGRRASAIDRPSLTSEALPGPAPMRRNRSKRCFSAPRTSPFLRPEHHIRQANLIRILIAVIVVESGCGRGQGAVAVVRRRRRGRAGLDESTGGLGGWPDCFQSRPRTCFLGRRPVSDSLKTFAWTSAPSAQRRWWHKASATNDPQPGSGDVLKCSQRIYSDGRGGAI